MKNVDGFLKCRIEKISGKPFHMSNNLRIIYILKGNISCRWVAGAQTFNRGDIEIINIDEPVCIENTSLDNIVAVFEISREFATKYSDVIDKGLFNCNTVLFYSSKTDTKKQEILKTMLRELYIMHSHGGNIDALEEKTGKIIQYVSDNCHDLKNMFINDKDYVNISQ